MNIEDFKSKLHFAIQEILALQKEYDLNIAEQNLYEPQWDQIQRPILPHILHKAASKGKTDRIFGGMEDGESGYSRPLWESIIRHKTPSDLKTHLIRCKEQYETRGVQLRPYTDDRHYLQLQIELAFKSCIQTETYRDFKIQKAKYDFATYQLIFVKMKDVNQVLNSVLYQGIDTDITGGEVMSYSWQ